MQSTTSPPPQCIRLLAIPTTELSLRSRGTSGVFLASLPKYAKSNDSEAMEHMLKEKGKRKEMGRTKDERVWTFLGPLLVLRYRRDVSTNGSYDPNPSAPIVTSRPKPRLERLSEDSVAYSAGKILYGRRAWLGARPD